MHNTRLYTILGFIFLGIVSRLIPHPPNFTAMNAIALCGAWSVGRLNQSFFIVFTAMLFSDFIVGFHANMISVYLSFGLIILLGHKLASFKSPLEKGVALSVASLLFFIVTNFGEWLINPLYPKTMLGLVTCYMAALPFLAMEMAGTFTYGILLFGCFDYFQDHISPCKIRSILVNKKIN